MTHDEQKPVREAFEKWYTEKYLGVNIDYVWLGYQAATTREAELLAVIRAMDGALRAYLSPEIMPTEDSKNAYEDARHRKAQAVRRLAEQVV